MPATSAVHGWTIFLQQGIKILKPQVHGPSKGFRQCFQWLTAGAHWKLSPFSESFAPRGSRRSPVARGGLCPLHADHRGIPRLAVFDRPPRPRRPAHHAHAAVPRLNRNARHQRWQLPATYQWITRPPGRNVVNRRSCKRACRRVGTRRAGVRRNRLPRCLCGTMPRAPHLAKWFSQFIVSEGPAASCS